MLLTQRCLKVPPTTNFAKIWAMGSEEFIIIMSQNCASQCLLPREQEDGLMIIPTGFRNSSTTVAKPCTMIYSWFLNSSVLNRSEKPCRKVMLSTRKNHTIKLRLSQHKNLMFGLGVILFVCCLIFFLGFFTQLSSISGKTDIFSSIQDEKVQNRAASLCNINKIFLVYKGKFKTQEGWDINGHLICRRHLSAVP